VGNKLDSYPVPIEIAFADIINGRIDIVFVAVRLSQHFVVTGSFRDAFTSFVGFESAAIYSEECRDPKRTVARATYIAVGLIAVFYALSSWLLGVAAGPDTIVSPDKLVAAGFASGGGPDPTTVLFITGQDRLGSRIGCFGRAVEDRF